jgi:hypothetical protein
MDTETKALAHEIGTALQSAAQLGISYYRNQEQVPIIDGRRKDSAFYRKQRCSFR